MAKKYIDVDALVEDWTEVNRAENPSAHRAWADFRRISLGCHFVPETYTVPTLFPPGTQAAADEYAGVVAQIRQSIKWNGERAKLPADIAPWRHGNP